MNKVRVGIMSFAHLHAEGYIHNLRAMPDIEYVGFADHDVDRLEKYGQQFQSPTFDSYEALLSENLDAVIICSENNKHRELTELAASAGVHILCEKPIATTEVDALAMIEACQQANGNLMIALPMRFSAIAQQLKQSLARGDAGTVYCLNTTNQGENPDYHRAWFSDQTLAGGGAVMDHTVHVVDLLRWYMNAEPVEVYAEIDNLFDKVQRLDVDTAGLLMITFDNGVFVTLDTSWSRPAFYPTWGNVKIDVIAEQGIIRTDYFKQSLTVYDGQAQRPLWHYWGSDPNAGMIAEFFASIREDRSPLITGEDGLAALKVVLGAYESGRLHDVVRL
ncbi:MAG: Gfo/Idh/MocA family oxidoreductase [Chloroflexota bacterium]